MDEICAQSSMRFLSATCWLLRSVLAVCHVRSFAHVLCRFHRSNIRLRHVPCFHLQRPPISSIKPSTKISSFRFDSFLFRSFRLPLLTFSPPSLPSLSVQAFVRHAPRSQTSLFVSSSVAPYQILIESVLSARLSYSASDQRDPPQSCGVWSTKQAEESRRGRKTKGKRSHAPSDSCL